VTRATELWRRVRGLNTLSRAAILIGLSLLAYLLVLPCAWQIGGVDSVIASAVAMTICLAGALMALVFADVFGNVLPAAMAIYTGMLFRMLVPLLIGAMLQFTNQMLADAGLLFYLAGFYFVTLAVEVVLTLPLANPMTTVERK